MLEELLASEVVTPPVDFLEEVMNATPGESRLEMCIQCGTCGGSCPSGADMDHSPRQIFAMIRADMREEVQASNTPWYCVSCYYCMIRCPQEVHIPDIMYTLKNMAIDSHQYTDNNRAADWSQTFVDYVENYGRSFEFGLATRHFLRHRPTGWVDTAQMGLGMLTKGRMDLAAHKIEHVDQLHSILDRAKELEEVI